MNVRVEEERKECGLLEDRIGNLNWMTGVLEKQTRTTAGNPDGRIYAAAVRFHSGCFLPQCTPRMTSLPPLKHLGPQKLP